MTPPQPHTLAARIKAEMVRQGLTDYAMPDATLERVIRHIGSSDLTFTIEIITHWPRYLWLVDIAGPHPSPPTGELTDQRDIADPREWGPLG